MTLIATGNPSPAKMIAQSYAGWPRSSVNGAGDASYTVVNSVTLPAGTMGLNSVLRITVDWFYPNSASTKTFALDFGGSNASATTATTSTSTKGFIEIQNKNSLSIQTVHNNNSYGVATRFTDLTVNTLNDVVIDFKCKWGAGVASETITLLGYSIWHYPGS